MVRRSERALGLAIREGQECGEIAQSVRITGGGEGRPSRVTTSSRPTDYATHNELVGNAAGIYAMTDNVTDEEFEMGLSLAKEEGNASRARAELLHRGCRVYQRRQSRPRLTTRIRDRSWRFILNMRLHIQAAHGRLIDAERVSDGLLSQTTRPQPRHKLGTIRARGNHPELARLRNLPGVTTLGKPSRR